MICNLSSLLISYFQVNMDLFHKIMELVDKNSGNIPEGDYLELCDTIQELREHVKPPRQSMQDGTTVAEVKIEDETITAGEALGHLRECI